ASRQAGACRSNESTSVPSTSKITASINFTPPARGLNFATREGTHYTSDEAESRPPGDGVRARRRADAETEQRVRALVSLWYAANRAGAGASSTELVLSPFDSWASQSRAGRRKSARCLPMMSGG